MKLTTGQVIRKYRNQKNISQKELAETIGVTEAAISRYEADINSPRRNKILLLSSALGISPEILVFGEDLDSTVRNLLAHNKKEIATPIDVMEALELLKKFKDNPNSYFLNVEKEIRNSLSLGANKDLTNLEAQIPTIKEIYTNTYNLDEKISDVIDEATWLVDTLNDYNEAASLIIQIDLLNSKKDKLVKNIENRIRDTEQERAIRLISQDK